MKKEETRYEVSCENNIDTSMKIKTRQRKNAKGFAKLPHFSTNNSKCDKHKSVISKQRIKIGLIVPTTHVLCRLTRRRSFISKGEISNEKTRLLKPFVV